MTAELNACIGKSMITALSYATFFVYAVLIVITFIMDWRFRRIPNKLTFSCALLGLLIALTSSIWHATQAMPDISPWWPLCNAALGGLVGFGIMFVIFLRGGVGGGDVKLFGAAGTLVGVTHIIPVITYSCLVGVVLGFAMAIRNGRGGELFKSLFSWKELTEKKPIEESVQPVPFGVAFAGGALWALLFPSLLPSLGI